MLVLARKQGQAIVIDGQITIRVVAIKNGSVQLGIDAPREVAIRREELPPWKVKPEEVALQH